MRKTGMFGKIKLLSKNNCFRLKEKLLYCRIIPNKKKLLILLFLLLLIFCLHFSVFKNGPQAAIIARMVYNFEQGFKMLNKKNYLMDFMEYKYFSR